MIFVVHSFGDKANIFLIINIAREFYWCMHFFICDFICLTLEFKYFVLLLFGTGFKPPAQSIHKYTGDYRVVE